MHGEGFGILPDRRTLAQEFRFSFNWRRHLRMAVV
jgi:hypothetical protein